MKHLQNLTDNDGNALGLPAYVQEEYYSPVYTTRVAYRDSTIVLDTEGYPQANRSSNDRYLDAAESSLEQTDISLLKNVSA